MVIVSGAELPFQQDSDVNLSVRLASGGTGEKTSLLIGQWLAR